ncbi:hypothetical protein Spock_24 [Bacillus phage Spock]|uniref:Uncharacterized protein n=2 Tax=Bequatrovirus spock TaxID=1918008 RepID=A0A1X9SFV6_9CAUD|nr:hypothetical protein Spock_24 [Bacillus phage Spock]AGY48424.1 hypothetical protein Spock_24 [Bacillus phage Spock]ARQ94939.1 hypothetical protein FLAPJACK_25 [Bacillus phage Flapjack]
MKKPYIDIDVAIRKVRKEKYGIPEDIPFGGEWRCSNMYQSFHPLGSTWREIQEMILDMEAELTVYNYWIGFTNLFRRK